MLTDSVWMGIALSLFGAIMIFRGLTLFVLIGQVCFKPMQSQNVQWFKLSWRNVPYFWTLFPAGTIFMVLGLGSVYSVLHYWLEIV